MSMRDASRGNPEPLVNRPFNLDRTVDAHASRLEGAEKVSGRARYARDTLPKGTLFVQGVRCPWGRAKLLSSDEQAARSVPGVLEVSITKREGEYHGDWIGHVLAEDRHALRRALRALAPRWERLPSTTGIDPQRAVLPPPDEKEQATLSAAELRLDADYSTPVQTHAALETHGLVVEHDGESAIVHASTQGTFAVAGEVAGFLGLPRSKYEVRCEHVGGGFGAKFQIGVEGATAAKLAAAHKRPVFSFCDRREEHLDTGNRPSMHAVVRLGFDRDGTVRGGRIHVLGGVGVGGGGGAALPSGRYNLGEVKTTSEDVAFNGGAPRAMRAPGHPQGAFAEELMLDEIAARAGVDPLALRQRLDTDRTGIRRAMYEMGAKLIGWERRQPNGSQTTTVRRGFGVGSTSWRKLRGPAQVEVVVFRDGAIQVRSGSQDIGTGFRTAIGALAAAELGVPLSMLDVRVGNSRLPEGPASGGSVTTPSVAPAVIAAARQARRQILEHAAKELQAPEQDLAIAEGRITRSGGAAMALGELLRTMPTETIVGTGRFDGREGPLYGDGNSHGVQFAEVEVDVETGVISVKRVVAFQACGKILSRKTAESQVIGGVIQGLSYALFENKLLDRRTGAMVNPNLEAYKILGPNDMPVIEPYLWIDPSQTGARGLGEPPVIPTAGIVAAAVFNAVGAPVRHLPLTPDKVLAAVAEAGAGRPGDPSARAASHARHQPGGRR